MIIDIKDGKLLIVEIDKNISSADISQLRYFGFVKTGQREYISKENIDDQLLLKVLIYFDGEKRKYKLSATTSIFLNKYDEKRNIYNHIFMLGRDYKDGKYDENDYRIFIEFLNNNISRKLREHQQKAAFHLYTIGNGANFSVPGSGKTTVVLSVYEKLRLEGLVNTLFVIGPTACFAPWRTEFIATLGRTPKCITLAGGVVSSRKLEYYNWGENQAELYLTTYQTLLNDYYDTKIFLSNENVNALVIIDEAHYIKQIEGEWAKAVLSLAHSAKYRCVLTGTPLPNSFIDIFNLLDFLYPDTSPLDELTKTNISLLEKNKRYGEIKNIYEKQVDPLIYRVRKKDLGLIPPIFHEPIIIEMNQYERKLYDALLIKIKNYSREDYLQNIDLIERLVQGRIMRLRQCASYAKLLKKAIPDYDENLLKDEKGLASIIINYDSLEKPGKLIYLLQMIKTMQENKKKVVIWSNFIETIKLIKKEIGKQGFKSEIIFGSTPTEATPLSEEKTREEIRDEFINEKSGLDILIANPAACSESISLHKTCFNAIYYDLSYNCAQYLQSLDRIHRVGGSEINQANYYFLQYKYSIDQDILSNLNEKAKRMYSLIEKEYNIYSLDMFTESTNNEITAYKRLIGSFDV